MPVIRWEGDTLLQSIKCAGYWGATLGGLIAPIRETLRRPRVAIIIPKSYHEACLGLQRCRSSTIVSAPSHTPCHYGFMLGLLPQAAEQPRVK
jgi:hypothetical protein